MHTVELVARTVFTAIYLVLWIERNMPVSKKRTTKRHPKRKRWHKVPRATVSLEPKTEELKSCPGGWVKLRRMSYGELLASNDMAFQVNVEAQNGSSDPKMGAGMASGRVAEYRFKTCIIDHNLENEAGTKLQFSNVQTLHLLDPNIGQEIDGLIDKMHNWEKNIPNSEKPSSDESSATSDQKSTAKEQQTSPSNS